MARDIEQILTPNDNEDYEETKAIVLFNELFAQVEKFKQEDPEFANTLKVDTIKISGKKIPYYKPKKCGLVLGENGELDSINFDSKHLQQKLYLSTYNMVLVILKLLETANGIKKMPGPFDLNDLRKVASKLKINKPFWEQAIFENVVYNNQNFAIDFSLIAFDAFSLIKNIIDKYSELNAEFLDNSFPDFLKKIIRSDIKKLTFNSERNRYLMTDESSKMSESSEESMTGSNAVNRNVANTPPPILDNDADATWFSTYLNHEIDMNVKVMGFLAEKNKQNIVTRFSNEFKVQLERDFDLTQFNELTPIEEIEPSYLTNLKEVERLLQNAKKLELELTTNQTKLESLIEKLANKKIDDSVSSFFEDTVDTLLPSSTKNEENTLLKGCLKSELEETHRSFIATFHCDYGDCHKKITQNRDNCRALISELEKQRNQLNEQRDAEFPTAFIAQMATQKTPELVNIENQITENEQQKNQNDQFIELSGKISWHIAFYQFDLNVENIRSKKLQITDEDFNRIFDELVACEIINSNSDEERKNYFSLLSKDMEEIRTYKLFKSETPTLTHFTKSLEKLIRYHLNSFDKFVGKPLFAEIKESNKIIAELKNQADILTQDNHELQEKRKTLEQNLNQSQQDFRTNLTDLQKIAKQFNDKQNYVYEKHAQWLKIQNELNSNYRSLEFFDHFQNEIAKYQNEIQAQIQEIETLEKQYHACLNKSFSFDGNDDVSQNLKEILQSSDVPGKVTSLINQLEAYKEKTQKAINKSQNNKNTIEQLGKTQNDIDAMIQKINDYSTRERTEHRFINRIRAFFGKIIPGYTPAFQKRERVLTEQLLPALNSLQETFNNSRCEIIKNQSSSEEIKSAFNESTGSLLTLLAEDSEARSINARTENSNPETPNYTFVLNFLFETTRKLCLPQVQPAEAAVVEQAQEENNETAQATCDEASGVDSEAGVGAGMGVGAGADDDAASVVSQNVPVI